MTNILSQEELDALFNGISGGETETAADGETAAAGVVPYDLTGRQGIMQRRMPTLELTNARFARIFGGTISSLLRRVVNISIISTELMRFGEFMRTLSTPTSIHLFKMAPLRGSALLALEPGIIFILVDLLFGGSGNAPYKVDGRGFTAIENNLIKKIVIRALSDLESAWKTLFEIKIARLRAEIDPQLAQIVPPAEVVVVTNYLVKLEDATGVMSMCIPYAVLEPIREKLQAGYQNENIEVDKVWAGRFKDCLMRAGLDIAVELGKTRISGRDLLKLQKGDVIRLNQFATDPLTVFVEGVAKYSVEPGYHKGNMAGRITELIAKEGSDYGSE